MRIIYIRLEGVLNSQSYFRSGCSVSKGIYYDWINHIDPNAIAALNILAEQTQANIVLVTEFKSFISEDIFKYIVKKAGFEQDLLKVLDKDPIEDISSYSEEVDYLFITSNKKQSSLPEENLFEVSSVEGLTELHLEPIITYFEGIDE